MDGKRMKRIYCTCGKLAEDVYIDDLGEWPMCEECLKTVQDEYAHLPLPDWDAEILQGDDEFEDKYDRGDPPFGLTDRQYQIAQLTHLSNDEIAEQLNISPATVQDHFNAIHKKLGIRSRHEIPYKLLDAKKSIDKEGIDQVGKKRKNATFTLSLTIHGTVHKILETISVLQRSTDVNEEGGRE
jgi:DNA-binding CsgD family transcriptional regulator